MLVWLLQSVDTIIQLVDALRLRTLGSFMALLKIFDRSGGALAAGKLKNKRENSLVGTYTSLQRNKARVWRED